jgi:hypothetical protein
MRIRLARMVVYGMAAVAVFVQIGVWGATKIRSNGAFFESWQPYFGWAYGLVFAGALVLVCRWLAIDRATVWLARTWAIAGILVVAAWWLGGRRFGLDDSVTLVAGLGAFVLAAGLSEGQLAPDTAERRYSTGRR